MIDLLHPLKQDVRLEQYVFIDRVSAYQGAFGTSLQPITALPSLRCTPDFGRARPPSEGAYCRSNGWGSTKHAEGTHASPARDQCLDALPAEPGMQLFQGKASSFSTSYITIQTCSPSFTCQNRRLATICWYGPRSRQGVRSCSERSVEVLGASGEAAYMGETTVGNVQGDDEEAERWHIA